MRLEICRAGKEFFYDYESENHTYHTERICYSTTQCRPVGRKSELVESLLCCAEGRRICGGAAKYAHHVAHGYAQQEAQGYGRDCAGEHEPEAEHVELHTAFAERAEEARPDFEAELIDKQHEAEILGIFKHARVDRQAEVTGKDTGEKHECHA